jgi:PAS domain S-box-containing protein
MTRFWKILYFIRGDVYITQMQNRTFNIVSFISALINLAAFINNMSIDVHPINLYLSLFGFIVYSVFYYLSRFVVYHNFYPTVYFIFTQIYLSVFWFVNAGSQGVVLTLWVAALPMYMANTANRYQMILVATVILNINLLYLLEYLYPQWVIPYNDVGTRMLDLGITNSVIITGLAICVYIYKNGFDEEREKNERNLLLVSEAKSEIRVQKIIQNSIDAVVSTNIDGQIMEWNMAATKLFGYTLAEVKNKKLSELIIPPHLRNNFENAVNYFSNKTNFIRFETNAVNAEGVYFPVELSLTLIEYDNKKVLNFFIRNLQEQKNNEKKILDQNEQLKSLYEEMDLLIYRSSHDLRGPVTNIGSKQCIRRLLP